MNEKPTVVYVQVPFVARLIMWWYVAKIVGKCGVAIVAIVLLVAFAVFAFSNLSSADRAFIVDTIQHPKSPPPSQPWPPPWEGAPPQENNPKGPWPN